MNSEEIKELWNKLTDFTHTYGQEDEVIEIINDFIHIPFQKDEYGNYFVIVGHSETLFVSHLDNAVKQKLKVTKETIIEGGKEIVKTDGFTILGADDKTGVVIMINMILNRIPGNYFFFIGEEVGTIGSLLYYKEKQDLISTFKRCVAFDRKGYGSIIVRQKGVYGCSPEFTKALSKEFKRNNMDFKPDLYGVGTDSASFFGLIPECVNLSVGYFDEHTYKERQDMDYMIELCSATVNINWENLPTVRIPKNWDTKKPEIVNTKENHLPLYKLQNIFSDIYKLMRSKLKYYASAHSLFEPGKQMRFYQVKDLDKVNNFSLWVRWDGSIRIKKDEKDITFKSYDDLYKILNKNNKKIRKLLGIVKLPHEIEADLKKEQLKKEAEILKKLDSNNDADLDDLVGKMMTSKKYNELVNKDEVKENKVKNFTQFVFESYDVKYGNILHLSFKGTEWFDMILCGAKKEEYREIKPYWESRLDGKSFDTVKIQMGRLLNSPTMYVECKGIEKGGIGNPDWGWVEPCYKIKLGKVLKVENYKK